MRKNVGRRDLKRARQGEEANYTFALTKVGSCEINVKGARFKKYVCKGLALSVNQSATLDVARERRCSKPPRRIAASSSTYRKCL